VDVVAPGDGVETAGEILLFVIGEDERGDHRDEGPGSRGQGPECSRSRRGWAGLPE
jgi:hypothetical protein